MNELFSCCDRATGRQDPGPEFFLKKIPDKIFPWIFFWNFFRKILFYDEQPPPRSLRTSRIRGSHESLISPRFSEEYLITAVILEHLPIKRKQDYYNFDIEIISGTSGTAQLL
jgi:hypothetical protein